MRELVQLHGDNLYSIVLYGSSVASRTRTGRHRSHAEAGSRAAAPDEASGVKRLLVVLKEIVPSDLKRVSDVLRKWRAAGNPIPAYFTVEEINDASDVFPIEFLDMSLKRKILAGQDPFANLDIPTYNLRHQVEYELRSKLIRLRALYLPASNNPDRLARLMYDSLQSFEVVFRHVITLLGEEAPEERSQAGDRLCHILGIDHSTFARIARFGTEDAPMLQVDTDLIFATYLSQIARIIEVVDSLPVAG